MLRSTHYLPDKTSPTFQLWNRETVQRELFCFVPHPRQGIPTSFPLGPSQGQLVASCTQGRPQSRQSGMAMQPHMGPCQQALAQEAATPPPSSWRAAPNYLPLKEKAGQEAWSRRENSSFWEGVGLPSGAPFKKSQGGCASRLCPRGLPFVVLQRSPLAPLGLAWNSPGVQREDKPLGVFALPHLCQGGETPRLVGWESHTGPKSNEMPRWGQARREAMGLAGGGGRRAHRPTVQEVCWDEELETEMGGCLVLKLKIRQLAVEPCKGRLLKGNRGSFPSPCCTW